MDKDQDLYLLPYNKYYCLKQTLANTFFQVQYVEKSSSNYSPVHSNDDLNRSYHGQIHFRNGKIISLLVLLVSHILSNHYITLYCSTWTASLANLQMTLKEKKWLT